MQSGLKHSLSDQEFNPRGEEKDVQSNALTASVPTRRYSDITGLAQKPRSGLQSEASQIGKLKFKSHTVQSKFTWARSLQFLNDFDCSET